MTVLVPSPSLKSRLLVYGLCVKELSTTPGWTLTLYKWSCKKKNIGRVPREMGVSTKLVLRLCVLGGHSRARQEDGSEGTSSQGLAEAQSVYFEVLQEIYPTG